MINTITILKYSSRLVEIAELYQNGDITHSDLQGMIEAVLLNIMRE